MKRKPIGVIEARNAVVRIFSVWSVMVAFGIVANMTNVYFHDGVMPFWPWFAVPAIRPISWALQSGSHFFGDWIVIGNKYLFSIGDILQLSSFPIIVASVVWLFSMYILPWKTRVLPQKQATPLGAEE